MSIHLDKKRARNELVEKAVHEERGKRTSTKLDAFSGILSTIKIHKAMTMAPGMDKSEVDAFLAGSKTPLRLATTNSKGEPNIHPVWYHYANDRVYLMSTKDTVKVRNIGQHKTVYFSIDTDAMPNKGVKGKGTAAIVKDPSKAISLSEKDRSKISWIYERQNGEKHDR